jgi:hypothetical protein
MIRLPFNYILDESDPDIVILRRQDGCFVAAFSASGATKGASVRPRWKTMESHPIPLALQPDEEQSECLTPVDDIHRSA